jgi:uncharacterized membrane protein YgcG
MKAMPDTMRPNSVRRFARAEAACPRCATILARDAVRCPNCQFTGADTLAMFAGQPPPLEAVVDAAKLWNESDLRKIRKARQKVVRSLPQFDWRVCAVALDPAVDLDAFAFWLFNTSPLAVGETSEARAWTVLLVIDTANQRATVIPGYGAEPWLTDVEWQRALVVMKRPWENGRSAAAVAAFFAAAGELYQRALSRVLRGKPGREGE